MVSGLEVTSEKTWTVTGEYELPVLIHLTKMDRERADFEVFSLVTSRPETALMHSRIASAARAALRVSAKKML